MLSATNGEFGPYQYFIWQRGQLSPPLEELPGAEGGNTTAYALNDRGLVAGTAFFENNWVPVVWKDGKIMPLDLPPEAVAARVATLNNEGVVIGDAALPTHSQAFSWSEGVATLLPLLKGRSQSQVSNINDLGIIIGSSFNDFSTDSIATLWQDGRALDINTLVAADDPLKPFVQLQVGLLINSAGQLVVYGHDARDADPTQIDFYFLTPQ